jgi:hypothetical protein
MESLTIFRELGIQWAVGFTLNILAQTAYNDGNLAQTAALISESAALFRACNAYSSLAEALIPQGHIVRTQGDAAPALEAMAEALRLA